MFEPNSHPDASWGTLWFGYADMGDRRPQAILRLSKTEMICLGCGLLILVDDSLLRHDCCGQPVLWMDPGMAPPRVRQPRLIAQIIRTALGQVPQFPEQQVQEGRIQDLEVQLRASQKDADSLRQRLGEAVANCRARAAQSSEWQRRDETLGGQGMER